MMRYRVVLASLLVCGCASRPTLHAAAPATSIPGSPEHNTPPPPIMAEGSVIALFTGVDGRPLLTIAPPAHWSSHWEAGEDTRQYYLKGDGVSMTVEFWDFEPTWVCRDASCGLSSMVVDGVAAKLLRPPTDGVILAFLPRRNDASRRGVSVAARCATPAACKLAEDVIRSIRGL